MKSESGLLLRWAAALVLLAAAVLLGRIWGAAQGETGLATLPAGDADVAGRSELDDLRAEHDSRQASWETDREKMQTEILLLTGELENAMSGRVVREEEFLQFTQMLTAIVPPEAPPEVIAALGGKLPEPVQEIAPDPASIARAERSQELYQKLRTLLTTERVDSLDLLEAGLLGDGWIGPVVFRTLDESGRPVGSLSADRLRLEGSRAGRTLTIVLEGGYERRGGERIPFENTPPEVERGGVRRIFLQQANPGPWFDLCAELFGPETLSPLLDDGSWHGFLVHRRLNELLARDVALGHYRLSALGGVMDDELRDVEIEHLNSDGRLIQRLFADRLSISIETRGVLLLLRDGIQMKGGHKYDFLGGRYRIFLPNAVQADWKAAGLPGLVPARKSSAGSHAPLQISNG